MKWIEKPAPKEGELRVKFKFLFFPKKIGKETRWLEFASWKEKWVPKYSYGFYPYEGKWETTEWCLHEVIGEFQVQASNRNLK